MQASNNDEIAAVFSHRARQFECLVDAHRGARFEVIDRETIPIHSKAEVTTIERLGRLGDELENHAPISSNLWGRP